MVCGEKLGFVVIEKVKILKTEQCATDFWVLQGFGGDSKGGVWLL